MTCLDDTTIAELVSGALAPDDEAAAKSHLESCSACRALVAETAKSLFSVTKPEAGASEAIPGRGARLGRYAILDVLGAGAMGLVYAAYDPRLDRRIALKLLHASGAGEGDAADAHERLLAEAKAMAKLSHPNVVAVHDVGDFDGRVFFAMDFVEGTTLAKWLEEPRALDDILDKFRAAGRGLAAAHAAGIVHRDFKAENVLVAADGSIKVGDFGLARPAVSLSAQAPASVVLVGTPAYLAPELWLGQPANALSDQFAFGVALYEACYGERPFAGETLAELEAAVLGGRVSEPKKDRKVPRAIRRALLRATSVRPEDRFASMDELLDAISDRATSQRRALVVAALMVLGAVALLGFRARTEASKPCDGVDRRAATVWNAEQREAIRRAFVHTGKPFADDAWRGVARALDGYTRAWSSARVATCEATQARGEQTRELHERRVECLERRLDDAAALVKVFADADGQIVEHAVEAAQGLPPLRDCATLASHKRAPPPVPDPSLAAARELRSELARVSALEKAGKYRDALAPALRAREKARALGYMPLEAETLHLTGLVYGRLRDAEKAEEDLRQAAEAGQAADDLDVTARSWIALVHHIGRREGRYESAHQWTRFAAAAIEAMGGNDKLEADRLYTLGIVLWKQGRHDDALADLKRALDLYKRSMGSEDVTVARALDGIAALDSEDGKMSEALELDLQALAIAERALGTKHPTRGVFLNNLGTELIELGRPEEAITRLRDALAVADEALGPEHPGTAPPHDNLGVALAALGKYGEAVAEVERAKAVLEKAGKDGAPDFAGILSDAGEIHRLAGDAKQALAQEEKALALLEKTVGSDHPDVGAILQRAGEALLDLGRPAEALDRETRALDIVEKKLGKEATSIPRILVSLARAQLRLGQPAAAVEPLERALRLRTARPGDPKELADTQFSLARALWDADRDRPRARQLAGAAREIYARAPHLAARLGEVDAWLASR